MPDLVPEKYYICEAWYEYCASDSYTKSVSEPPACRWNQFTDGGSVVEGKCPECGGSVSIYFEVC